MSPYPLKHLPTTREIVHDLIPRYAKGLTLDVGAGTAKYREFIRAHVTDYKASDIEKGPHIDFVESALSLSHADRTFDTVLSFQTLEHVEDPNKVLSELRRVLRPGGVCVLTVPFLMAEHSVPSDYRRYTVEGAVTAFKDERFEIIEAGAYGGTCTVLAEGLKFFFIHPWLGRTYGRIRRTIVERLMCLLYALDRRGWFSNPYFYANVYIVAQKPL